MRAMDSRQPSLLEGPAPRRAPRSRPSRGLLARLAPRRGGDRPPRQRPGGGEGVRADRQRGATDPPVAGRGGHPLHPHGGGRRARGGGGGAALGLRAGPRGAGAPGRPRDRPGARALLGSAGSPPAGATRARCITPRAYARRDHQPMEACTPTTGVETLRWPAGEQDALPPEPATAQRGLVRYEPGSHHPFHKHDFAQVWYILEGEFQIGDRCTRGAALPRPA